MMLRHVHTHENNNNYKEAVTMKVLLINGSPNARGCTFTALCEVARQLEKEGISTELIQIGTEPVRGCVDCGGCTDTGCCVFDDGVNIAAQKLCEADGLVVGAPVYYASPNGSVLAFLDRMFSSAGRSCFMHKPAAAVVSARRAGTTASLDVLNKYFSLSGMPIASSQYWNMVHGNTPNEVAQDIEGLQIMRTLGSNMAWMIKCIAAGKDAGVPAPLEETRQTTSFIR